MNPENSRSVPAPCPFCGAEGKLGQGDSYHFNHSKKCWISLQQGTMLNHVSYSGEEMEAWNSRVADMASVKGDCNDKA